MLADWSIGQIMFAVSAGFQSTCLLVFSVCLQLIQLAAASSQSPQPTIDWEALQAGFEAQGVTIPSCLDRSYYLKYGWSTYANFTGGKRDIVLEVDWWDSALIVGYTFASLVTQVMGYNVDLRVYDGGAISGSRLHYGVSDIALELWGSDASTWYTQYVQLDSTVSNYGSVGYDGRVGLYFPSYLLDDYPHFDALDFWKGLTHPASQRIFPRFGTAPATLNDTGDGPLCDGIQNGCMNGSYVPAWYREEDRDSFFEIWHEDMTVTPYYYNRLIDGLKLNGTVRFLGNSVYTNMQQAYANRKPFLFYNWRPCVTTASYNLTRMIFPDDQTGQFQKFQKNPKHQSVNVDLPVENMFKASSSKFNADFPELGLFLSKFSFPEETMIHMLAVVGVNSYNFNDSQYTNLVCSWLKENEVMFVLLTRP
ncbi:hypothetical protein BC830DRAFT_1163662 [Chytriomyces sp. MP71]|nr:hypothetical protein BC830DRAFT_1163662 [Chytriomyces sp. MP71]